MVAPLVHNKQSLHVYDNFCFALFPLAAGRQFEVDNLAHVEWMGRLIGRIHGVGKGTNFVHRLRISVDEYLLTPIQTLHNSSFIPSGYSKHFHHFTAGC